MSDNDTTNPNTYTATVSLDIKGICDAVSDKLDIGAIKEDVLEDLLSEDAKISMADYVMDSMDGDYRLESIIENFIDGADLVTSDDLGTAIDTALSDDLGPAIDLALEDLIPELQAGVTSERVHDIETDVTKLEEAVFGSNEGSRPHSQVWPEGSVVVTSQNFLAVLCDTLAALKGNTPTPTE